MGGNIFVHDLFKHPVFNTEKDNSRILTDQIILMDTVLVQQTEIPFLKNDIFVGNSLPKVSFYDIPQFNVIVRMELSFCAVFKRKAAAEFDRRRVHGGMKLRVFGKIPA